jgi:hypothetical protein
VVYAKPPFGGPQEVLRYLACYTHRVAISNRRLVSFDNKGVTFKWKDYRLEGPERYKQMTLDPHEFHPPLPDAGLAAGLPPHPPLRPVRRQQSRQCPRPMLRQKLSRQAKLTRRIRSCAPRASA